MAARCKLSAGALDCNYLFKKEREREKKKRSCALIKLPPGWLAGWLVNPLAPSWPRGGRGFRAH